MREHMGLYRGKQIGSGEWVEGWLVIKKDPVLEVTYCFILAYGKGESFVTWYPVDPDTVGECTGLRDKNGKLIFEGDIVKETFEGTGTGTDYEGEWGSRKYYYDFEGYKIGKVVFGGTGTHIISNCGELWIDGEKAEYTPIRRKRLVAYRSEVIGNTTDNPELLKGGEQQ